MRFLSSFLPLLACLSFTALAVPYNENHRPRQSRADNHTLNRERAAAVKEAFVHAWDGYERYAFPADELRPLTYGGSNSRYGC